MNTKDNIINNITDVLVAGTEKAIEQELNDKWKEKKQDNIIISKSFLRLAHKHKIADNLFYTHSEKLLQCANYVEFKVSKDNGEHKLHKVYFCKNRLCPLCNWRRSKKTFAQVARIVNEINKENKYDYIFLTLTIRNCLPVELKDTISKLSKSFNNMFRYDKRVINMCKGYFRGIEITRNKRNGTYHPHIHCIVVVEKSYFKTDDYIIQEEWREIWKHHIKVDYLPNVDVRKVKSKTYIKNGLEFTTNGGVAEVSKYSVKSKDIILKKINGKIDEDLTDDNIYTLYFALKGKRLVSFGGLMKEIHKRLNLEDMNDDNVDLIKTDVEDDDIVLNYIILKYKWCVGISNYKLVSK